MGYYELILVLSKLEWIIYKGYYNSFLNWGISISPEINDEKNILEIETIYKNGISIYDIILIIDGTKRIEKINLETMDYIEQLNQALIILTVQRETEKFEKGKI